MTHRQLESLMYDMERTSSADPIDKGDGSELIRLKNWRVALDVSRNRPKARRCLKYQILQFFTFQFRIETKVQTMM
jgi:hypothetical protein